MQHLCRSNAPVTLATPSAILNASSSRFGRLMVHSQSKLARLGLSLALQIAALGTSSSVCLATQEASG